MTQVFFGSDFHLGHKNIPQFRNRVTGIDTVEQNTEFVREEWKKTITKRDIVYLLGDICFHSDELLFLKDLPGTKYLVMGNHDFQLSKFDNYRAYDVFEEVFALKRYKHYWLSHAPIHPMELRGRQNIHGHCHMEEMVVEMKDNAKALEQHDDRYINVNLDILYPKTGSIFLSNRTLLRNSNE